MQNTVLDYGVRIVGKGLNGYGTLRSRRVIKIGDATWPSALQRIVMAKVSGFYEEGIS